VRQPRHLEGLDGLVIPGGESTTMLNLMHCYHLFQPIRQAARDGLPIIGTCAGMILLAKKVSNPEMDTLALMDIAVHRNAFGRQVDSFEAMLDMPAVGKEPFTAVFIRAPFIGETGADVEILGSLPDGAIVAARQGNLLALAFHPELGSDTRLHRYFLEMAGEYKRAKSTTAAGKAITAD